MFYVRGSDASAEGTHDAHDANGAYRKWGRRDFSPVGDAAARVLPLEQSRGFLVSCGVDGGVLSTPGHSPDSVSVVLDSGDVFVGDLCPSERVALFPNPAYRRSWETLLEHDTRRVHFAHWPDKDFQGATPARMQTPSCTNRRTRRKAESMSPTNPFTPEFGSVPLVMAGRQSIRRELFEAFSQGRGNPNLSSILIGPRGSGKTALLTYLAKEASDEGWVAVHAVAMPGMLEDIYEQTRLACANALGKRGVNAPPQLTSVSLGPVGVGWTAPPVPSENWRTRMSRLIEILEGVGLGLLITVDEVVASLDEMINLAAVYQLFVREQRRVALVMAGLPNNISALLNDKSVSFLRRAQQHKLDTIPDPDVREAFRETAAIGDRGVTSDALEACVSAIEGYPYMLQLVGFRCWQASNLSGVISAEAAERGIEDAREDFRSHILEPTFRELSEVDVRFIEAMLADNRESRISDVAKRMGVESRYASKYRSRLLAEGVIEQVARGVVRFALPEFKAFVQEELGD